ncbi:MAG: hypothetical protein QXV22_05235, partial [Thermoplasmataceae archaeon]
MQKLSKYTIVVCAVLLIGSFVSGLAHNSGGLILQDSGYRLEFSTNVIHIPPAIASDAPLDLFVNGTEGIQTLVVEEASDTSEYVIFSQSFLNVTGIQAYIHLKDGIQGKSLLVFVNGKFIAKVPLYFKESSGWILSETLFICALAALPVGIYFWPFRNKATRFIAVPCFFALAALLGQRYDDYFLITSGARLAEGINPFIQSSEVPPSLKWEYPPIYLYWTSFVSILSNAASRGAVLEETNSVYPFVRYGFAYTAWRALTPEILPELYLIYKIPLIFSVLFLDIIFSRNVKGYDQRSWILNPAVILLGIFWGQIDVLAALFMVLGILNWQKDDAFRSALFFTLGGGVKVFPILALPYVLMKTKEKRRAITGIIAGLIPSAILYLLAGSPVNSVATLLVGRSFPTYNGIFVTNGFSWQVLLTDLRIQSFPSLFLYAFIPIYFLLLATIAKRSGIVDFLIAVFLLFYLTYNFLNPQYIIWVIPLFIMSRRNIFNLAVSGISCLYTLLTYSATYFLNPILAYNYIS